MKLTVGSCFAGIGGIDLGLEASGHFSTAWWSEVEPGACRVMAARFPDAEPLGDILAIVGGLFPPPPVDVVAGGPPCQDISKGNAWGRRGLAGAKSGLFHAYIELIAQVQPEWIVMEQVTGLLTSGATRGADWLTVTEAFKEIGYAVEPTVVNSLAYVPQTRERLVLVGHRDGEAAARAVLPLRQDGGCHPDAGRPARRRPAPAAEGSPAIYRKSRRPASNLDGETWVIADYANTLTLNDTGLSRATVIVLDSAARPRILTPEEWEGCHGFPRGWTEPAGSDAARWNALGNAVSPPLALRIGEGIAAAHGVAA